MCIFFQAEDGIRHGHVTGVQTCALPIFQEKSVHMAHRHYLFSYLNRSFHLGQKHTSIDAVKERFMKAVDKQNVRSEERRVGKECRAEWTMYQDSKKSGSKEVGKDAAQTQ